MNDYKNGTYQGIVLYANNPLSYNYGEAFGLVNGTEGCYFEVTGDWNEPPNTTKVTYPKGGEIVDDTLTATWNKGTDPDGGTLTYRVGISNGSGGWIYYNTSATSYKINTSGIKEHTNARIAVKVIDSKGFESPWSYSPYFTISHNKAPTAPTNVSPSAGKIFDKDEVIRFSWKYNDTSGTQAGFQLAWRTVASDGTRGSWNYYPSSGGSAFSNTTRQYYNMPAGTLVAGKIEWAIRTKDQQGATSPWTYTIFTASSPTNAPTITVPATGNWNSQELQVSWSSINQVEYQVYIYDDQGATLWSKSGTGTTKTVYPDLVLENNKTYGVWVRAKSSDAGLWSEWSSVTITTAFTPPPAPFIERFEEAGEGVANMFYKASDINMLPDFLIGSDYNPRVVPYSVGAGESVTVTGVDSYTMTTVTGQSAGLEITLDSFDVPIVVGKRYRISATSDVAGIRVYLRAYDASGATLATSYFPNASGDPAVTSASVSLVLPAGTTQIKGVFYNSPTVNGTLNVSNCRLYNDDASSFTDRVDILRREYTPEGDAPWITVATDLSASGSFLDYTLASDVPYEFKVRSLSANGTSADSAPKEVLVTFESTLLQSVTNFSDILQLSFCTAREGEFEIESETQMFAGRTQPVREFGEHETVVISIEWEVDTYIEVKDFLNRLRKRDTFLYRDGNGRRYFVTAGQLKTKDKPIQGFELSIDLTVTSYIEDLKMGDEV
ncbi:hypothetical protein [Priestia megaterium]|uniref:hypothetical protein n=1 Tax=Priestia megaterium TaxID=1404 RepID=UPI001156048B|nr:hypothetical protein [Priestia megaterium]